MKKKTKTRKTVKELTPHQRKKLTKNAITGLPLEVSVMWGDRNPPKGSK